MLLSIFSGSEAPACPMAGTVATIAVLSVIATVTAGGTNSGAASRTDRAGVRIDTSIRDYVR